MQQHIVQFSSGIASWAVAQLLLEHLDRRRITLLFADTKAEDSDNYRFLRDASDQLGLPVVPVCEGRTPDQVFRDEKFLGNNRLALCSRILKIEPARRWLEQHYPDPDSCVLYVGIDAGEPERAPAITRGWQPYRVEYPLLQRPDLTKDQMLAWARRQGLRPPRMYDLGFSHANCAGRCVRAGQAHWLHLLQVWPEQYAASEALEREMRAVWGKDVAHLRATHAGKSRPLTLAQLRRRQDAIAAFAALPPARKPRRARPKLAG